MAPSETYKKADPDLSQPKSRRYHIEQIGHHRLLFRSWEDHSQSPPRQLKLA